MSKFYSYGYFLDNRFENWDPDKFDWKNESKYLAMYCYEYFNIWWNPDKYNWKDFSHTLAVYCYRYYFNIWWDPNKFNWRDSIYLAEYCNQYFESWWDTNKFFYIYSHFLALYCYEYFNIWWDPYKFNWENGLKYLASYCYEYINIWWNLDKAVKYFNDNEINDLVELNNEYNLLDKAEIIKLKLLKS